MTVVLNDDVLRIELRDGKPKEHVNVKPGQVDWEEPSDRIHRAINVGGGPYEEIAIFFLGHPDDVPQPDAGLDYDQELGHDL